VERVPLILILLLLAQATHPLTGRQIAPVMGAAGAGWLDRPERESEEAPDQALDALGIRAGMLVADVGAGTGYMSLRMARRVGPTGKVYANDLLPANTLDLVLLVDVYHEFSQPQAMLDRIRESLKPDGRLVLLEYRKEDPSVPIRIEHKMSVAEVKTEVEAEGYKLDQVIETLPRQHIIIFRKSVKGS